MSSRKITTPKFRVSFPCVFTAKSFKSGAPKFSLVMLFDKNADLQDMNAICREAAEEKWGTNLPKGLGMPFHDGAEKEYAGYEGTIYCPATSLQMPGLIDQQRNAILSENDFYPGCYARATVVAFAYDTAGNKGVSFGLQNVQKMADGDRLDSRKKAEEDFDSIDVPAATTGFSTAGALNDLG